MEGSIPKKRLIGALLCQFLLHQSRSLSRCECTTHDSLFAHTCMAVSCNRLRVAGWRCRRPPSRPCLTDFCDCIPLPLATHTRPVSHNLQFTTTNRTPTKAQTHFSRLDINTFKHYSIQRTLGETWGLRRIWLQQPCILTNARSVRQESFAVDMATRALAFRMCSHP